jgi:solute carrier family 25 uncoupling protein 8/9
MSPPPSGPPLPLHKSFAASAVAACTAEVLTLPLDMAKVRLQLQGKAAAGAPLKYR